MDKDNHTVMDIFAAEHKRLLNDVLDHHTTPDKAPHSTADGVVGSIVGSRHYVVGNKLGGFRKLVLKNVSAAVVNTKLAQSYRTIVL